MSDRIFDPDAMSTRRVEAGLSMAALARTAGVSYSFVKQITYHRQRPSDVIVHKLAVALGCTAADLTRPRDRRAGAA